jgi:hypothetical protein
MFPFRFSNGKVRQTQTYDEVVRGQIIDSVMTNHGERVFRPNHGCDIQSALFDPRDELTRHDSQGIILRRLQGQVPRAEVLEVTIDVSSPDSTVYINIKYRSSKYGAVAALSVPVSGSEFVNREQQIVGGT